MGWGTMVNATQEADRSPSRKHLMPFSKFGFDSLDKGDTTGE